jgi:hypothetical protein
LKEKDRVPAPARTQAPKKAIEKPKGKSNNHNVFAVLDSDSEEEVVAPKVAEVKEEFPSLPTSVLTRTQSVSTNYAAALSRPAPPKPVVMAPPPVVTAPNVEAKAAPWASSMPKASTMKSWAAWDSDSEDDEEDSVSYDPYQPYAFSVAPAKEEIDDDDW